MGKPSKSPNITNRIPGTSTCLQPRVSLPLSAQEAGQLGNIRLLVEACRLVNVPGKSEGVYVVLEFVVSGQLESSLAAGPETVFLLTAGQAPKTERSITGDSNERQRGEHTISERE